MRKIWLSLPLILAPVVAWPVYVGVQVERILETPETVLIGDLQIDHVPQTYQRENYRAGFSSVLEIRGESLYLQLQLEHRVRHRLLGASLDSRLVGVQSGDSTPPGWRDALMQARPRMESWVGLGGGVNSRLRTQPVRAHWNPDTVAIDAGPFVDVAPGQGGLAYSKERLLLSFDTPALSLFDGEIEFNAQGAHFGLLIHPGPNGDYGPLPDYDLSLGVDRLVIGDGADLTFVADALRIAARQNSAPQHLDSLMRLRVERVGTGTQELAGLEMNLNLLRLDRSVVLRLLQDLDRVRAEEIQPEARAGLVSGLLLEAMKALAPGDPLLQAALRVNEEPAERLNFAMDLSLSSDPELLATRTLDALIMGMELELGRELLAAVRARLIEEGVLGAAAADGFDQWLAHAVSEGWVEDSGNVLKTRLRLDEGRLWINDEDRTLLLLALMFAIGGGMF